MNPAILFALGAMIGYGFSNAWAQKPIKKFGALPTIFWRGIFATSLIALCLPFFKAANTWDLKFILLAVAISIPGYAGLIFFYKALNKGKMGIVTPVGHSSVIVTIAMAILFFEESLTPKRLAAAAIIVAGIILISINFKDWRNSPLLKSNNGVILALGACLSWGIVFALLRVPVNVLGPIITTLVIEAMQSVYVFAQGKLKQVKFWPSKSLLVLTFWVALGGAIGNVCYNLGIMRADTSLIAAITFANPIVPVIYGRVVNKDRMTRWQYLAVAIIIAGIVLISYFK